MNIYRNNKIIPSTVSEKERIRLYLDFVKFFNKFINHRKKPHQQFIETDMRV